jgi:cytochrome c oxidase cbb3-type subunit 2
MDLLPAISDNGQEAYAGPGTEQTEQLLSNSFIEANTLETNLAEISERHLIPVFVKENVPTITGVRPYTPLEVMGRDLYIREGCVGCHSQQIRMLRAEVQRYGPYSLAGESVFDRPFLWGSKRTGPDLARVGERYSDEWHRVHLRNPRTVVPESNMPGYPWLAQRQLTGSDIENRMRALRFLGVPYTEAQIESAPAALKGMTEEDAMIAYLQGLGTGARKAAQAAQAKTPAVGGQ